AEAVAARTSDEHQRMDAEEDRGYLYPTRGPAAPSSAAAAVVSAVSSSQVHARKTSRRGAGFGTILKVAGISIAIVVLIGVLGFVAKVVFLVKPNGPPLPVIAELPELVEVLEAVPLDATGSSDPDGDPMTYTWRVTNLDRKDYRIEPNGTSKSSLTAIQFFQSGQYTIELRVFDGKSYSTPITRDIIVSSKR
ncbi:PKD domain-containing protein, partial [Candidatus Poribacteria bacterium]|nr:PKD domain-containing protein [Candidatus Poribacteria bacterium]